MKDRIQRLVVPHLMAQLKKEGIAGLEGYEQRLSASTPAMENFKDLLFEADAALMFSRHGFKVTMRDKPDLRIELNGEVAYAEVKHFREKEQDRIDERAMWDSEDLVPVGILSGQPDPWWQIVNVAIGKEEQYVEGAPNLLVIASDSNAVDGSVLPTGVHLYNQEAARSGANSPLCRLNAFLLVDMVIEVWTGMGSRNVYFCPTAYATVPISAELVNALSSIQRWSTPRDVTNI
jgi:hypothetical protein